MLDLPPVHGHVVKEAALAAYRLLMEINPQSGDYVGHLRIYHI